MAKILSVALLCLTLSAAAYAQFDSSKANRPVASMAPKVAAEAGVAGGGGSTFKGFLEAHAGFSRSVELVIPNTLFYTDPLYEWAFLPSYHAARRSKVTVDIAVDSLCIGVERGHSRDFFWSTGLFRRACVNEFGKVSSVWRNYPLGNRWGLGHLGPDSQSLVGDSFDAIYCLPIPGMGCLDESVFYVMTYKASPFGISAYLPKIGGGMGSFSFSKLFSSDVGSCFVVNEDTLASGEVARVENCSGD